MTDFFNLDSTTSEQTFVSIAKKFRPGQIVVYPSDSGYSLGCTINDEAALTKIIKIRNEEKTILMTILCNSISQIHDIAQIDNRRFKIIKNNTPSNTTFIVPLSTKGKKIFKKHKREEIGIHIPRCESSLSLLKYLDGPIFSCSFKIKGALIENVDYLSKDALQKIDYVINHGAKKSTPSTITSLIDENKITTLR